MEGHAERVVFFNMAVCQFDLSFNTVISYADIQMVYFSYA